MRRASPSLFIYLFIYLFIFLSFLQRHIYSSIRGRPCRSLYCSWFVPFSLFSSQFWFLRFGLFASQSPFFPIPIFLHCLSIKPGSDLVASSISHANSQPSFGGSVSYSFDWLLFFFFFGSNLLQRASLSLVGIEGDRMSFQDLDTGRPLAGRRDLTNGRQDQTQAVAAGLFQITTAVRNFERLVNTIGTPKDTPQLRDKLNNSRLQISQLVKDTSAKLKLASETDHRVEVSASKKVADAKLAKDFQNILKEFQKFQRLAAERETAFAPLAPEANFPQSYDATEADSGSSKTREQRALLADSRRPLINVNLAGGRQRNTSNHAILISVVGLNMRRDTSAAAAASTYEWPCLKFGSILVVYLAIPRLGEFVMSSSICFSRDAFGYFPNFMIFLLYRQELLLLDNEIVFNEAIIEEREQGIQEIQQQIGQVNEIFKDLAVLVNDQGIVIDDINSHIESSHAATLQAKSQLKKAEKTQKSNSSLMCLLLVIFGIILLIVIIIIAA
ncbi:hypothetical protein ZIOFF_064910 [Zingiber officinale]|uniref:t-SNARE coiled-coil homology domain-containing protein n=1 Tax=Zingiber officinale TaxID=94328 RepID=A0A8J5KB45_ZINOF|nr:hypothetical protein ZIOFF_064910 [Zingiber officinale]